MQMGKMKMDSMTTKQNNPLMLANSHHRIALVTHVHPDGDAYGSVLGLKQILSEKALVVDAFAEKDPQSKFSFLPAFDQLKGKDGLSEEPYDLCFVLDCGNEDRVQEFSPLLALSKVIINIDHHVSNTKFGHVRWLDPTASSTSEIVTALATDLHYSVSADAATCLLTGIMMDTGSYLYDNTTEKTHLATAFLLEQGADHASVRYHLFQNRPLQNVKFLGYLIDEMELLFDDKVVFLTVSDYLLKQFNVAYEDLDEFIAYVRDIEGVELAIIFKELSLDETKLSLRSKKWCNVNKLASNFNGGGHERAAGAVIKASIEETRKMILPLLKKMFNGDQL